MSEKFRIAFVIVSSIIVYSMFSMEEMDIKTKVIITSVILGINIILSAYTKDKKQ